IASSGARTRSCGRRRRFSPRRSSTADRSDDRVHRRRARGPRGRADLRAAADRPVDLLCAEGAGPRSDQALRSGATGRDVAGRDPARVEGELCSLRRGEGVLSIRYTERLAAVGIEPSVGSVGDSYDNALAESVIGLYKTEVIRARGPWRHVEAVEFVTLAWVDWFNTRRLLAPIGYVPPREYEDAYYRDRQRPDTPAMGTGVN